jgi:hypothetical protein
VIPVKATWVEADPITSIRVIPVYPVSIRPVPSVSIVAIGMVVRAVPVSITIMPVCPITIVGAPICPPMNARNAEWREWTANYSAGAIDGQRHASIGREMKREWSGTQGAGEESGCS